VTLNRFFAFHVIALPLVLVGLVAAHIIALHEVGSNNPDGVEIKKNKGPDGKPVDGIPFHPYYTVKDIFGVGVFLIVFSIIVFFNPELKIDPNQSGWFLEANNFIPADPLKTPEHIVPLWYFTPFYAILRAVPDKFLGVVAMGLSIAVLFVLPWLDRSPIKSIRYRGVGYKVALAVFVVSFLILGWLGTQPPTPTLTLMAQLFSLLYFGYFAFLFFYSRNEKGKPVPDRVTD
jgi:ubiquinol-cytochrome c reductase cytochrome b subunit